MKITTYTPDGSIKEVREHHVQVPEYINTFDAKHSFLDIIEKDVALALYKRKDYDKGLLLNQYRFLLRYDYDNYLKSNARKINFEDEQGRMKNEDTLEYYDHVLSFILHSYRLSQNYPNKLPDEAQRFLNDSLWIDTLLYHARKTKNRVRYTNVTQEQNPLTNNLIGIIHRLYYALRKADELGHLGENEQIVMYLLSPFANIRSSQLLKTGVFDNDFVLAKMIESMYLTKEKCRDSIYSLVYAIESSVHMGFSNTPKSAMGYVAMMTNKTKTKDNIVTLDATPLNSIEVTKIELPREEIVCLVRHYEISQELLTYYRDYFEKEFDVYYEKNFEDIKKITNRQAKRYYKEIKDTALLPKQWKEFYYYCLDSLESEYKRQFKDRHDLTTPFCYYYILVDMCDPGHRYEFKEDFLEELVNLALQKRCIGRCDLYEQMVRLNYIEESAFLIPIGNAIENAEKIDKIDQLRQQLLSGENASIARDLECSNVDFINNDDAINRALVFLSPLYSEKYMVDPSKTGVNNFCTTLQNLLKKGNFAAKLKTNEKQQDDDSREEKRGLGFNVKLILNIIGVLSKGNIKNGPLKKRIADSLKKDLKKLWKLERAGGYNSYINKYNHNEDVKNESQMYYSFSVLNCDMIKEIIDAFSK